MEKTFDLPELLRLNKERELLNIKIKSMYRPSYIIKNNFDVPILLINISILGDVIISKNSDYKDIFNSLTNSINLEGLQFNSEINQYSTLDAMLMQNYIELSENTQLDTIENYRLEENLENAANLYNNGEIINSRLKSIINWEVVAAFSIEKALQFSDIFMKLFSNDFYNNE